MHKITKIAIVLSFVAFTHAKEEESPYPIHVPHFIDGTDLGIDEYQIHNMLYIIKEVNAIDHGEILGESRVGRYECEGKKYSIHDLTILESEGSLSPGLQAILKIAVHDLLQVAEPFIEQGRSVKAMTLEFLAEWAYKHKREDSFLLHWSKQEDGKEIEIFENEVVTFSQLHDFCRDLVSFLTDLIKSCPRALEQFKAKKHQLF